MEEESDLKENNIINIKDDEFIDKWLRINNIPLGRWPSKTDLNISQQIAVNIAVTEDSEKKFYADDIFSRKSLKLLKALTASNVVKRAEIMCRYENSDDAYADQKFLSKLSTVFITNDEEKSNHMDKIDDYKVLINSLMPDADDNKVKKFQLKEIEELFNFDENGSKEFYTIYDKAIRTSKIIEADDIYFTYPANYENSNTYNKWGLICVSINNDSDKKKLKYIIDLILRNFLNSEKKVELRQESFNKAKEEFIKHLNAVNDMKKTLNEACLIYDRHNDIIKDKNKCIDDENNNIKQLYDEKINYKKEAEIIKNEYNESKSQESYKVQEKGAFQKLKDTNKALKKLTDKNECIESIIKNIKAGMSWYESLALKNSIIRKLIHSDILDKLDKFISEKAKVSQTLNDILKQNIKDQSEYNEILINKRKYEEHKSQLVTEYNEKIENIFNFSKKIILKENKILQYNKDIAAEEEKLRKILCEYSKDRTVPDEVFWNKVHAFDSNEEDTNIPWITEEYKRECEKLFYCGLQLNKEFILSSNTCRDNLKNLYLMLDYEKDENNHEQFSYKKALDGLFMLVPIISITDDYAEELLQHADDKSIGIVVADYESKHATVQSDELSKKFNKEVIIRY